MNKKVYLGLPIIGFIAVACTLVLQSKIEDFNKEQLLSAAYVPIVSTMPLSKEQSKMQAEINKVYELNNILLSSGQKTQIRNEVMGIYTKERKELIKDLIKTNPRSFFAIKLSDTDRAKLAPSLQADVEKKVILEGTTEVIHIDDFKNEKNSRYEYYLNTSKGKIQIYPTSPLNLRSGAKIRITGYQVDTMLAADSNAETVQTIIAATTPESLGDQKVLVFLIDGSSDPSTRPFTNAQAYDLIFNDQIQKYYKEQSYNQLSLSGKVYGWFVGGYSHEVIEALIKANNIDITQYGRIVYIVNSDTQLVYDSGTVGKVADVFNGVPVNISYSLIDARYILLVDTAKPFTWRYFDFVFAHEFGHNLGLYHAGGLDCGDQVIYYGNCTQVEYGNNYDVMAISNHATHFNSAYKNELGWLGPRLLNITASGRYTLSPFELPTGLVAAKISNPSGGTPIFVEYRKGVGFDASLNNPDLISNQQGLFINDIAPSDTPVVISRLLDMTPTNADWYADSFSTTLNYSASGQNIFTDPGRGITIGPVVGYTANSITFDVTIAPIPCIRSAPQVNYYGLDPLTVNPGGTNGIYILVTNTDSLSCGISTFTLKPVLPQGWTALYNDTNISFLPGSSRGFIMNFQVPLSATGGTYSVGGEITNLGSNLKTTQRVNVIIPSAAPTVTSLTPSSGFSGTQVTITGTGFTSTGNTVIFGTSTINNLNSSSNTIIFTVSNLTPPGNYQVSVRNTNGTSNAVIFTITKPPLPTVTSLTPSSGFSGTQVTITGTGFTSTGNTVIFGTSTINNLNSSSNTIIFTVSNLTPPGVYQVLVTNANGKSNAMTFTVTSLLPIGTPILISGGTTGTLRNNFSGWVGFKFKVGSTSLSVSQLGRYVVKGSIGSHTVKLVAISGVSSGTDVPGGSVIVKTYGAKAETYAYTSLVFPVTLQANTTYMLVSQEIIGGDQWYDYLHNVITLTNDATPINAVWALNNTHTYNFTYTWPQTYGPVNLRYSTIGIVPPPPLPPPPPPPLPPPLPLPVTR